MRRPDETPIRRRSIFGTEPSPGTPPGTSGKPVTPQILPPSVASIAKFARRFSRMLGLAASAPVDGYLSDVVPALALNQVEPEDIWPDDVRGYGQGRATAAAGQFSMVELFNPPGSQKLVVVERVTISQETLAAIVSLSYNNVVLPAVAPGVKLPADTRALSALPVGSAAMSAQIFVDALAAVPGSGAMWATFFGIGAVLDFSVKIVLTPGFALLVSSQIAGAQTTTVSFRWREIPLPVSR